jgi:hypothetical protein
VLLLEPSAHSAQEHSGLALEGYFPVVLEQRSIRGRGVDWPGAPQRSHWAVLSYDWPADDKGRQLRGRVQLHQR